MYYVLIINLMEKEIIPFVIFLITFIALNIVGYSIAFKNTKEKVYKDLSIYWGLVLFIVLGEGSVKEGTLALSLIFLCNFPAIFVLSRFLLSPYNYNLKTKNYLISLPIVILLSVILNHFKLPGPIVCLPVTIICSMPFLEALLALLVTRKEDAQLDEKILGTIVALMGIGCVVNYGLNRFDPTPIKNIVGFGTALITYLTYSIFLPMFCIGRLNKEKIAWLEKEVNARTMELLKSKQEKEKLLSVLIHDISNPLMSVVHNIKKAFSRQEYDRLKVALQGLNSIKDILEHVKEYESVLRGRRNLDLKEIHLTECLDEIEEIFKHQFREKNIQLNIQNNLPFNMVINVDKTAFVHSVASNLISNALKFSMQDSEVRIVCCQSNSEIIIKIIDSGIGIPKEMTDKLFDIGSYISRVGTEGERGSGFGLPIVNAYVSLFGGRIEVSSSQETDCSGTTFALHLPKYINNA